MMCKKLLACLTALCLTLTACAALAATEPNSKTIEETTPTTTAA